MDATTKTHAKTILRYLADYVDSFVVVAVPVVPPVVITGVDVATTATPSSYGKIKDVQKSKNIDFDSFPLRKPK